MWGVLNEIRLVCYIRLFKDQNLETIFRRFPFRMFKYMNHMPVSEIEIKKRHLKTKLLISVQTYLMKHMMMIIGDQETTESQHIMMMVMIRNIFNILVFGQFENFPEQNGGSELKKCFVCSLYFHTEGISIKRCAQCKVVMYCSRMCQKVHWTSGHRKECV